MNKVTEIEEPGEKTSGWRGSRELWLDVARRAFVEGGIDAVRIQPLAAELGLSRTSFYWFFKDRDALLEALLEAWDVKNTGGFIEACGAYAETVAEAVLNLIAIFLDEKVFEPRVEFAVRGWAHGSDAVMARINAADERRLFAIRAMFRRFGMEEGEADVRARTVYLVQIGYISMQVEETTAVRLERIPSYVKIFAGVEASEGELARFEARFLS